MYITNELVRVSPQVMPEENLWKVKGTRFVESREMVVCMAMMDAGGYEELQEEVFLPGQLIPLTR